MRNLDKIATLFIVDNCPICPKVGAEVGQYLSDKGHELLITKPGLGDLKVLAEYGFPALYLPKGFEGLDQDLVLVGADAPKHLKVIFESKKEAEASPPLRATLPSDPPTPGS